MKKFSYAWWGLIGIFAFIITYTDLLADNQPVTTSSVDSTIIHNSESDPAPAVTVFGRDDCGFCVELFNWLKSENIPFNYLNVTKDEDAAFLFSALTTKYGLSRVTPITVIDDNVIVGFNSPRTTGGQIKNLLQAVSELDRPPLTIDEHLSSAHTQTSGRAGGCSDIDCEYVEDDGVFIFDLPIIGLIDLKTLSLFSLSLILGIIDGFNPCAMWVLITFLALLAQAGSKKKMVFLAGLFIVAQGVMYNLILNVWYKTWDFVALDEIVTPLVGFLALGGGLFFLYRWYKNRQVQLVCDITSIDTQMKTVDRFKRIVNQPITIASVLAIFVIAFSINIIEFACSIGIPQAYTKILEMNMLTFWERQWYILIFTLAYMFDDVVVFGLAIWGYSKLQAHGQKYAHLSLLIGGVLMALLGALLIFFPNVLVL